MICEIWDVCQRGPVEENAGFRFAKPAKHLTEHSGQPSSVFIQTSQRLHLSLGSKYALEGPSYEADTGAGMKSSNPDHHGAQPWSGEAQLKTWFIEQ